MFILPIIPVINKWNKIDKTIFPNSKAIVIFNGNLNSTIGLPKLTKFIRDSTYLNTASLDVLIGLFDSYLKKGKNSTNVRVAVKQSIINFPFMWTIFIELSHYFSSLPAYLWPGQRLKGKKVWSINNWNKILSCFKWII
jgi:hypothetical protein